ncbi:conserved hypothetical protein [Culex quinquefasciatus]|uniref:ER-bound oxygenase mpaB/mpaB'/Rubber oxygenase catalytic domain-containing protein n=1 Tax=Culex quinquefasciatus TaxID=7176 RepID=B0WPZ5_CULQU|nr:conserved hypothetical protein [Culex quinquefasciatus]|eukprot:XP_001850779.1 conserved hypothetical protein [Culex quinquefasciatus]
MSSKDKYLDDLLSDGETRSVNEELFDTGVPPWYDRIKVRRAQRFFRENFAAIYYATICGLLAALTVPSILNALIFTTRKPTFKIAAKRYLAAMKHTINWYCQDFEPGSSSWKSLEHVRRVHSTIVKRANAKNYGIIISQKDLAITQFAFMGYVILNPGKVGSKTSPQDLEALCHFWRVLGFLLGLEDRFNVCTPNMEETIARIDQIQRKHLKSALTKRDDKFERAAEALLAGLWCFNLLLDHGALMFAAGRVAGLPGYSYWSAEKLAGEESHYRQLGWKSRGVLFVILSIHEVMLQKDWFRNIFNWILLTSGQFVIVVSNVVLKIIKV